MRVLMKHFMLWSRWLWPRVGLDNTHELPLLHGLQVTLLQNLVDEVERSNCVAEGKESEKVRAPMADNTTQTVADEAPVAPPNNEENASGTHRLDELAVEVGRAIGSTGRVYDLLLKWDKDHSGSLSAREINAAFKSLGLKISPADLKATVRMLDQDGTGHVEMRELYKAVTVRLSDDERSSGSSRRQSVTSASLADRLNADSSGIHETRAGELVRALASLKDQADAQRASAVATAQTLPTEVECLAPFKAELRQVYYYYSSLGKASEKRTSLAGVAANQFRQFVRDLALPSPIADKAEDAFAAALRSTLGTKPELSVAGFACAVARLICLVVGVTESSRAGGAPWEPPPAERVERFVVKTIRAKAGRITVDALSADLKSSIAMQARPRPHGLQRHPSCPSSVAP